MVRLFLCVYKVFFLSSLRFRPAPRSTRAYNQGDRRGRAPARSCRCRGGACPCPSSRTARRHLAKPTRSFTWGMHQMPGAPRCPVPLVPVPDVFCVLCVFLLCVKLDIDPGVLWASGCSLLRCLFLVGLFYFPALAGKCAGYCPFISPFS
jgi:hypothetical protein